jgi:hypothetical protein
VQLTVWVAPRVQVTTRPALLPDYARDFCRPGFSALLPQSSSAHATTLRRRQPTKAAQGSPDGEIASPPDLSSPRGLTTMEGEEGESGLETAMTSDADSDSDGDRAPARQRTRFEELRSSREGTDQPGKGARRPVALRRKVGGGRKDG